MKLKSLLEEKGDLDILGHHIDNGQLVSHGSQIFVKNVSLSSTAKVRLENLKNFPYKITGKLDITNCQHLTTLEGSVMDVEILSCIRSPQITSLEGIGRRYIKRMVKFFPTISITSNILGLVLVKDLERIDTLGYTNEPLEYALGLVWFEAMENHPDILECKEKLIAKGYKDFAKL